MFLRYKPRWSEDSALKTSSYWNPYNVPQHVAFFNIKSHSYSSKAKRVTMLDRKSIIITEIKRKKKVYSGLVHVKNFGEYMYIKVIKTI